MNSNDQQADAIQKKGTRQTSSYLHRSILNKMWRKRVPVLLQMSEVECGLASLAMILSYHGRETSISELRTQYGASRDGVSALNLVKAARTCGMIARAVSLRHNDFKNVTLPAIIHWQFNHFLIVERWTPTQ